MRYHDITTDDMKNGDGLRVVLWVAGCEHHCEGCQNPITWDPNDGLVFGEEAFEEICFELGKDHISGLTLSGGDPIYKPNRETTVTLCAYIKSLFPEKTIWLYTGYDFDDVLRMYVNGNISFSDIVLLNCVDVIVDREFEKDKLDVNYPWAGSTNQRVIDVKESLKEGKVVLHGSNQERWDTREIRSSENCGCCS